MINFLKGFYSIFMWVFSFVFAICYCDPSKDIYITVGIMWLLWLIILGNYWVKDTDE